MFEAFFIEPIIFSGLSTLAIGPVLHGEGKPAINKKGQVL